MSEEFCDGVKILLKRMESNPEEFKDTNRWEEFTNMNQLDGFWSNALTPAELDALQDGMRKIYRELFTNRVMAKLLEDKEEVTQGQFRITERYGAGWSDPRGLLGGGGTVTLGGSGVSGSPFQNVYNATSDTPIYPRLSPYAESQPPSSSEILARTKKFLGLK